MNLASTDLSLSPQLISIVGPTATGKTKLALQLTKVLANDYQGFDLISADSRQVYQGLEIISGADLPAGFKLAQEKSFSFPFYQAEKVNIHGISIISAQAEWSVTHFQQLALAVITSSLKNNRLPIVVGGTGLYHQHLFNQDPKLYIKPNAKLRAKLSKLSVTDLQKQLDQSDPTKLMQMNNSDRNNPTRLIRAIEIAFFGPSEIVKQSKVPSLKQLTIGLTDSLVNIESKIKLRVQERMTQGALEEVNHLLSLKRINKQVLTTTGVQQLKAFINHEINQEKLVKLWTLCEFQYAKRQLTWWKKRANVIWFAADKVQIEQISKRLN